MRHSNEERAYFGMLFYVGLRGFLKWRLTDFLEGNVEKRDFMSYTECRNAVFTVVVPYL